MIYKNGIRVWEIVTEIDLDSVMIKTHIKLTDGKVWTHSPKKLNPKIIYDKSSLETMTMGNIAMAIQSLNKEMEDDKA